MVAEPGSPESKGDPGATRRFDLPPTPGAAPCFAQAPVSNPLLPLPALPWADAVDRLRMTLLEYPELIGGRRRRLDTDLIRSGGGSLIAKSGGEGVQAVACIGRGWGLALKVADGGIRPVGPWICATLERLGILDEKALAGLAKWWDAAEISSTVGKTASLEILPGALPPSGGIQA